MKTFLKSMLSFYIVMLRADDAYEYAKGRITGGDIVR